MIKEMLRQADGIFKTTLEPLMKYYVGCQQSLTEGREFSETITKIRELQKRPDGIFGSFMTRPVSPYVTYAAFRLGLSANAVSILSFVFCIAGAVFMVLPVPYAFIIAAIMWWVGAIFDAADGDLARFTNTQSSFGGWLDSFFDRIKEFMIFSLFAYAAYKTYGGYYWFILGSLSAFSSVMSGYISDTRKIFDEGKRNPQVTFSKKYIFGMVDTRDFFVILSLFIFDVRISLVIYSTFFIAALGGQFLLVVKRYGSFSKEKKRG
jgi:phosphatidylglycerophosphate synthase